MHRTTRRIAAVLAVALMILGGIALPASAAKGGKGKGTATAVVKSKGKSQTRGKSQNKRQHGKAKKAARAANFAATGTVTAVDAEAGTLTVAVKGGSKNVSRTSHTFTVGSAVPVTLDDAPATLGDLQAGDHAAVTGSVLNGVFTVKRVNAEAPEPVEEEPVDEGDTNPTEGSEGTDGTTGGDTGTGGSDGTAGGDTGSDAGDTGGDTPTTDGEVAP